MSQSQQVCSYDTYEVLRKEIFYVNSNGTWVSLSLEQWDMVSLSLDKRVLLYKGLIRKAAYQQGRLSKSKQV